MATVQSAKRRGSETQTLLAEYLRRHGWPYAESTGAGRAGVDVTGTPGLAWESKARRDFSPQAWLKQASLEGRDGLPLVAWRPIGYGAAAMDRWPTMLYLGHLVPLLHAAGYGDGTLSSSAGLGRP